MVLLPLPPSKALSGGLFVRIRGPTRSESWGLGETGLRAARSLGDARECCCSWILWLLWDSGGFFLMHLKVFFKPGL